MPFQNSWGSRISYQVIVCVCSTAHETFMFCFVKIWGLTNDLYTEAANEYMLEYMGADFGWMQFQSGVLKTILNWECLTSQEGQ